MKLDGEQARWVVLEKGALYVYLFNIVKMECKGYIHFLSNFY